MKTKLARKSSSQVQDVPPVSVVLAYDSPRACRAIMGMLGRISSSLSDQKLFKINAFRFSLLERMDAGQCAAETAETPELAVVAFDESSTPGMALLNWLESWAKCHAGKEAALGLLLLGSSTSGTVRRFATLSREIAARHGLGFICEEGSSLLEEQCSVVA